MREHDISIVPNASRATSPTHDEAVSDGCSEADARGVDNWLTEDQTNVVKLASYGRGGWAAVRRRHPSPGFAREPRRPPEACGKIRSADRGALRIILERGDFVPSLPDEGPAWAPPGSGAASIQTDPAIVAELIENSEASLAAVKREIRTTTGPALLDFILRDIQELRRILTDPKSLQVIMPGVEATWWLNDRLHDWLGEKNAADTLTRSVANDVTSEMGLALLDVADAIRPHAKVVAFLERVEDDDFLDALPALAGGREARDAIQKWLDRYGMRCVGEIDITRPRWSERPTVLVPAILGNITNSEPRAGDRRFDRGREAGRLVRAKVLRDTEDIFWLRFEELPHVIRTHRMDEQLIRQREDAFRSYQALTPPRVLTSDGEAVAGSYRRAMCRPARSSACQSRSGPSRGAPGSCWT